MLTDNLYWYRAELQKVTDGDTIHVRVDLGMRTYRDIVLRFENIDAPEITGVEKPQGLIAKDAAAAWLAGRKLVVKTYKDPGSYDRYTAEVYDAVTEEAFTAYMIAYGFAEAYDYKWG